MSFAVIDFETTGILPSQHHRVVEVGVAHVEFDGTVTGRWETLVNPRRDLGPQGIHGIRAAQILEAPEFADIAPDLAGLLRGRVVVAHNASFDLRFLHAEFERAGHPLAPELPSLCTMRLGSSFGLGGSCALGHACEAFEIELAHAHSAGDDAYATAQLLSTYRQRSAEWDGWGDFWAQWAVAAGAYAYPSAASRGVAWQPRERTDALPPNFLERIAQSASTPTRPGAEGDYLALLDRCLLDGLISVSESIALAAAAADLGLDRGAVEVLNARYFDELIERAWDDGVLTEAEQRELAVVGELLRIPESARAAALVRPGPAAGFGAGSAAGDVDAADVGAGVGMGAADAGAPRPSATDRFTLEPGDMIVLTGQMARERSEWEAILHRLGFVSHPGVTKKIKLLVAADPDSLSGKAKKARDYGIPVVDEAGLARLLGVDHAD